MKKSIKTKMITLVGLTVAVVLILVTALNSSSGKRLIGREVDKTMTGTINREMNRIESDLEKVTTMLQSIARMVGSTYETMPLSEYEKILSEIIKDNDIVLGSGIWFKEYAYDPEQKYVGPYMYKDGDEVVVTYDYSNEEYDYFNQEYYLLTVDNFDIHITDPYYDETSDLVMASSSIGIRGTNGEYVGCITVDIELSSIEKIVGEISVGETGTAVLTTASGTYLAGVDDKKKVLNDEVTIDKDENKSLATAAAKALATENGKENYQINGKNYILYYDRLPATGWKLFISIAEGEINTDVTKMTNQTALVGVISVIACITVVFLLINNITKDIQKVNNLARNLADGNFTVDKLDVHGNDEMAQMSSALNNMYDANKGMLTSISGQAKNITLSSQSLEDAAAELNSEFSEIERQMSTINESMMTSSAATQEINAGVEEVNTNINVLADETSATLKHAHEIQEKAAAIEKQSKESAAKATELSTKFEVKLKNSIENAAVVENISQLAEVIANIASQIDLLSLNASIEAARAGEQGRGFAVVAGEIGKLAGDTAQAVANIQNTISDVQNAFEVMSDSAKDILAFVQNTVTTDYEAFVDVASRYGSDAEFFATAANGTSDKAEVIRRTMNGLAGAAENVAESSQLTAEASNTILGTVQRAGDNAEAIKNKSEEQLLIADSLEQEVAKFKL